MTTAADPSTGASTLAADGAGGSAPVRLGPRLVVAGTASGVGKTTVATGLMAALRRRGHRVAAAKVGPDYIDPGYHTIATGRPGRNLDAWLCGLDAIGPLAGRASAGAEILVVEGVMGLFDGAADGTSSSTAAVARQLAAPVVLVVDAAAAGRSVAATVHGFATFDPTVTIAGVVVNNLGGDSHEAMVREAIAPTGVAVLGALHRDGTLTWRDRHLGLVPVVEQPDVVRDGLDRLADRIDLACDLDALVALATRAPWRSVRPVATPERVGRCRVAVAAGPAFSFSYPDNLEALEAAGAELVPFDPLVDPALPPSCSGLIVNGGFPEEHAVQLAANRPLLADARRRIDAGMVVWAECGGLLWLGRTLDDHAMVGALDTVARLTDRLTMGYRTATTNVASPVGPAGTELRGHEFHYTTVDVPGTALSMLGRSGPVTGGHATPTLLASYLHLHLGADPRPATAFVRRCVAAAPGSRSEPLPGGHIPSA